MDIVCDECGSDKHIKAGFTMRVVSWNPRKRKALQQYRCKDCGHLFINKKDMEDCDGTRTQG